MIVPTRGLLFLLSLALVASLLIENPPSANIQDDSCGCNAVLVPTVLRLTTNRELNYAYLRIIDQRTFEEVKRRFDSGVSIPIEGIPIGADMSWEDFRQRRESLFQLNNVNLSYNEAVNRVSSGLPQHVTSAWTTCKQSCGGSIGFKCWPVDSSEARVIVTCSWNPPPSGTEARVSSSSLSGGSSPDAPHGKAFPSNLTFQSNSRQSFEFKRNLGETLSLVANVSGFTTTLTVPPPFRPIAPREPKVVTIDTILCSGRNCNFEHILKGKRDGVWQVVEWKPSSAGTKSLGPQMQLKDADAKDIFCKPASQITTSDMQAAFQDISWVLTDNPGEAQFFDLDAPRNTFEASSAGRFFFFNNCERECDHHIRMNVSLTLKRAACVP